VLLVHYRGEMGFFSSFTDASKAQDESVDTFEVCTEFEAFIQTGG